MASSVGLEWLTCDGCGQTFHAAIYEEVGGRKTRQMFCEACCEKLVKGAMRLFPCLGRPSVDQKGSG